MKSVDLRIPARSISMLLQIKQAFLADNETALKVSNCGNLTAAHYIDDLINTVTRLETDYQDLRMRLEVARMKNEEHCKMLGGYTIEVLTDKEKSELQALVEKWRKADDDGFN